VNAGILVFAFEKQIRGFVSPRFAGAAGEDPARRGRDGGGGLGDVVAAGAACPAHGTVDAAFKALVPIVGGVGVYFIARARARACSGGDGAAEAFRRRSRGYRSCGMRSRGPRKYCIGE
jgi:hypothetical protein